MEKIKFYSTYDLSKGYYLEKIVEQLQIIQDKSYKDINIIMSFFNISQYDKNKLIARDLKTKFDLKFKIIYENLNKFIKSITDNSLLSIYKKVDFEYRENFWEYISSQMSEIKFTYSSVEKFLGHKPHNVRYIIHYKNLVEKFSKEIKTYLIKFYTESAELLINEYVVKNNSMHKKHYFPSTLTLEEKEKIILSYVNSKGCNLNYLRLILFANSSELKISDKTKLLTQQKISELESKLFNINSGFNYGVEVRIKNQIEEMISIEENHTIKHSYSIKWLSKNKDYPTILNNFIHLFNFVDNQMRILAINKEYEMGFFEKHLTMQAKNEYITGVSFHIKQYTMVLQTMSYYSFLQKEGIRLEDVIKWFPKYLKEEFGVENFVINIPSLNSTYFEKCRSLLPEIDSVTKEFNMLVEEGNIDQNLMQISTNTIPLSDIKSLISQKYIYKTDSEINNIMFLLFSDQSMLDYIEKHKSYKCLFQLIYNEDVKYSAFQDYQKNDVDWLIDKNILQIENELIKFVDLKILIVLFDLYKNEFLNYNHYPDEYKNKINSLIDKGYLKIENTLLSAQEAKYFDYYLNKKTAGNGLELRNKYLHSAQSPQENENEHYNNYIKILNLIILLLIKINDDLCIRYPSNNIIKK